MTLSRDDCIDNNSKTDELNVGGNIVFPEGLPWAVVSRIPGLEAHGADPNNFIFTKYLPEDASFDSFVSLTSTQKDPTYCEPKRLMNDSQF